MDDFGNEILWTAIADSGLATSFATYGGIFGMHLRSWEMEVVL